MSVSYLLDTTLMIDHAKGRQDGVTMLARLFEETGRLYTCDIVSCEALSGGVLEERLAMTRLLDALEYLAIDPEGARWAGHRRRELRSQGHRSPLGDSLIAAVAWRMDATVVTRNPRDFEPFGVKVLGYGDPPASEGTKRGSTS
jgi:predicted nucleic acid-binding protein